MHNRAPAESLDKLWQGTCDSRDIHLLQNSFPRYKWRFSRNSTRISPDSRITCISSYNVLGNLSVSSPVAVLIGACLMSACMSRTLCCCFVPLILHSFPVTILRFFSPCLCYPDVFGCSLPAVGLCCLYGHALGCGKLEVEQEV